jgi:predicted transcriptional regulator
MVDLAQNGTKDRVLNAIKQGVSDPKAIATWIGIGEAAVRNAIKRLLDAGDIRRKAGGGYEPAPVKRFDKCVLAEAWR